MSRPHHYLFFLGISLFLFSCAASSPETLCSNQFLPDKICHVAVLPFVNQTKDPSAGIIAYRVFSAELIASGVFTTEPEGDVQLFFQKKRLLPGALLDSSLYHEIGSELGVDAVIVGNVLDSGMTSTGREGDIPEVALQVEIIDVETGIPAVYTYHRRNGEAYRTFFHYGVLRTKSELLSKMSDEIIDDWKTKGISHCSGSKQ